MARNHYDDKDTYLASEVSLNEANDPSSVFQAFCKCPNCRKKVMITNFHGNDSYDKEIRWAPALCECGYEFAITPG